MTTFIAKRIAAMIFVLFSISVLVFLIFFATPGVDPAARIAGRNADQLTLQQVRASFDLDKPIPARYVSMMKHLFVSQDLTSYVNRGAKVLPQLTQAIPATLSLVFGAAIIWLLVGIFLGIAAASSKRKWMDPTISFLGIVGISLPVYWLGEVVNLITQSKLHNSVFRWVPPLGYVPLTENPFQWFLHLIFPWLTLALLYAGIYIRVLRSEILGVMREDYVKTERAKGASEKRILYKHATRMSLITIVSLFGLDFGALVGGSALLTEVVFGIQGVGKLTFSALQNFDLPVIMATVMYASFFVVLANAIVDILYAVLDPRVRRV
ncbi:MAG: ABC transporter permease [Actinomycetes bacterium]